MKAPSSKVLISGEDNRHELEEEDNKEQVIKLQNKIEKWRRGCHTGFQNHSLQTRGYR